MVRDHSTGKYRRTRLFVLTLGYIRQSVRLQVFRSSSQTWAELHEKAFRRIRDTDHHPRVQRRSRGWRERFDDLCARFIALFLYQNCVKTLSF